MRWAVQVLVVVPILLIGFVGITYVHLADPFGWISVTADFSGLSGTDRVEVAEPGQAHRAVTDPDRVGAVVTIVQSLEEDWKPIQFPRPQEGRLRLRFYSGERLLRGFAFGNGGLVASDDAAFYSRRLSQDSELGLRDALGLPPT